MRRPLRLALAAFVLLISAIAAVPMARLHSASPLERTGPQIAQSALPSLRFLRGALENGAGEDMQALFPEGYFFTYVLYGLSWTDLAAHDPSLNEQALVQARWALAHLDSPKGKAAFSRGLEPEYGVFYQGWQLLLRAGIAQLAGPDSPEHASAAADARQLAAAYTSKLDQTGSPFLTAYPGQAWPCDSVVGMAAVQLAGRVTGTSYAALTDRWLAAANTRRDKATGLLPHTVSEKDGQPTSGARATSQVIILRFLVDLDQQRGIADWLRFRELFSSTVPGLPAVREYPPGTDGAADVDTGPLVLGISGSASAVALGAAVRYGDRPAAAALTGLAETFGIPVQTGGKKRYLAGQLPVADAFAVWAYTARPALPGSEVTTGPSWSWRLIWYAVSSFVFIPMWTMLIVSGRHKRADKPQLHQTLGRAGPVSTG